MAHAFAQWWEQAAIGLAPASRRALISDLTSWCLWSKAHARLAFPIAQQDLLEWLVTPSPKGGTWLVATVPGARALPERSVAMVTIRRRLWSLRTLVEAVRLEGKWPDLPDPTRHYAVRAKVRGLARWAAGRDTMPAGLAAASPPMRRQRPPLLTEHEAMIRVCVQKELAAYAATQLADYATPLHVHATHRRLLRDWALLLVARETMARRDELSRFRWDDLLRPSPSAGPRLIIRSSKTDQEGAQASRALSPETAAALDAWRVAAGRPDGPIFVAVTALNVLGTTRLTGHAIDAAVRGLAIRAQVPLPEGTSRRYGAHSTRIGMAIDLARAGAGIAQIMAEGRWTSVYTLSMYLEQAGIVDSAVLRLRAQARATTEAMDAEVA